MIHIVVALGQEAKPLIKHWKLKRSSQFSNLYFCADKLLVISGMGSVKSASALGFLVGLTGQKNIPKLNVGIAGHPYRDLGTMWAVNKIVDIQSDKTFYPGFSLLKNKQPSLPLSTVTKPVRIFDSKDCLVDMEGAGFFESATMTCNVEHIALMKIISDNQEQPFDKSRIPLIPEMIGAHLGEIDDVIMQLTDPRWAITQPQEDSTDGKLNTDNFSATQSHELKKLTQKWHGLKCGPIPSDITSQTNPKVLLQLFKARFLQESKKMSF